MADDLRKEDSRERSRVSGSEDYEVRYFAEKHGLAPAETLKLIREHGGNRAAMEAALTKERGG